MLCGLVILAVITPLSERLPSSQTSVWSRSAEGCLWRSRSLQCAARSKWTDCEAEPWAAVPLQLPWTESTDNAYRDNSKVEIRHFYSTLHVKDSLPRLLSFVQITPWSVVMLLICHSRCACHLKVQLMAFYCFVVKSVWNNSVVFNSVAKKEPGTKQLLLYTVRLDPVLVHVSNSDTRGRNGSATISCYNYLLFWWPNVSNEFLLHLDQNTVDSFEENVPE